MAQNKCEGMTFSGNVDAGKLLESLMKAMEQLMKGGGGGGAGEMPTSTDYREGGGCLNY